MEAFHTTTRLVALLVVVLGDRHNPFALPLDQAPRLLQMMASTKHFDVQAGPSTRNTSAVIISGHVRYQRSSHQVYAAKQQSPDTRRKGGDAAAPRRPPHTASALQMLLEPDRMYRAREGEAVYIECSVLAWPPATILCGDDIISDVISGDDVISDDVSGGDDVSGAGVRHQQGVLLPRCRLAHGASAHAGAVVALRRRRLEGSFSFSLSQKSS
ncbi:uncharacterized protein LOC142913390 isoform X2 [Petromyzon marinus]|uniref:uncharacterized protein LOC142913390 isoform X2 n=1 Tax=Petromyzon marinus TaxID=7757 RepID=UPI003F6EFCAF